MKAKVRAVPCCDFFPFPSFHLHPLSFFFSFLSFFFPPSSKDTSGKRVEGKSEQKITSLPAPSISELAPRPKRVLPVLPISSPSYREPYGSSKENMGEREREREREREGERERERERERICVRWRQGERKRFILL